MTSEENLKRFCLIKGIDILKEQDVLHGKKFILKSLTDTVHLTLFPLNNLVQGKQSNLKEVISSWAGKAERYRGGGVPDLASGWREWDENADWIEKFHKTRGVPKEDSLTHMYRLNREILFHDYMFRNSSMDEISVTLFEKLVRSWFHRNCFMDLKIDEVIYNILKKCDKSLTLSKAAWILAEEFSTHCPSKYVCLQGKCYCPQTESNFFDCVSDIVDALYPYFSKSVLSYTKGNLSRLLKRDMSLAWTDISPSSPIEEIMSNKLVDAGILTIPQYQAWDEKHRYSIDFVVKTPQGINIAIECDGLQYHANKSTYIHDRKRDRYLQDKGFYMMRFSSVEIYNEIDDIIKEIDMAFWKIQKKQLDLRTPYRISYFGYANEE